VGNRVRQRREQDRYLESPSVRIREVLRTTLQYCPVASLSDPIRTHRPLGSPP
jgi:hypothetical protein